MPFPSFGFIMPATAIVISNDVPSAVKWVARAAKWALLGAGDRIQICDGVDDNVEIQAAVDALPSGGTLSLSEGNLELSDVITLKEAVYIVGSGMGVTVVRQNNNAGAHAFAYVVASPSWGKDGGISNLTIQGGAGSGDGVYLERVTERYKLEYLHITGMGGNGIHLNASWGIALYRVEVHGNAAAGVFAEISSNMFVFRDSSSRGNGSYGLQLSGAAVMVIDGSSVEVNGDQGIFAMNIDCLIVTGSYLEANTTAEMHFNEVRMGLIYGNYFNGANATARALRIGIFGNPSVKNVISGNQYRNYTTEAITIGACAEDTTIEHNYSRTVPTFISDGGIRTRYSNQHSDLFMNCIVASVTHVRAAMTPDGSTGNAGTAPAENGRGLMIRINNTDGVNPQSPSGGDIVVHGIDAKGNTISETFTVPTDAIVAGGNTDIIGDNAFASGITVDYYTETNANVTVSVGTSDKLGLKNIFYEDADVYKLTLNAADKSAYLTAAKVDSDYETVNCDEVNGVGAGIAGGDNIEFCYRSNLNIAV